MNTIKKHLKKELLRAKKNPGKKNRQRRREENGARRGKPVPGTRVTETKKAKAKRRNDLKAGLRKAVRESSEQ